MAGRTINLWRDKPDLVDMVSDNLIYQGWADWGNPQTSEPKFLIRRVKITGTLMEFKVANGVLVADQIWDNRASLTYKFTQ